jgi:hypothetical protein
MTSNFNEDQEMTKQTKLIDTFTKINDNYTITNCNNGFVLEVSGQNSNEDWITGKFVLKTIDELKDVIQDLAVMTRA